MSTVRRMTAGNESQVCLCSVWIKKKYIKEKQKLEGSRDPTRVLWRGDYLSVIVNLGDSEANYS